MRTFVATSVVASAAAPLRPDSPAAGETESTHPVEGATRILQKQVDITYRRPLRTTNTLERTIEEVRPREKVIRIFPNERSAWRLLGAFLAELHEEWFTGRMYLKMETYTTWKPTRDGEEVTRRAA